jgi:hypothetical protein
MGSVSCVPRARTHPIVPGRHSFAFPTEQATLDAHFPAIGAAHASFLDQLRRPYHNDQCSPLPLTPPSPRSASLRREREREAVAHRRFTFILLRF